MATLTGLVTPFGTETVIGDLDYGGFYEQIAPGAFAKTLRANDVVLVVGHDLSMPLARMSAGNLKLWEASDGLRMEAEPTQTSYGKDLTALARDGVVKGMSFGFRVISDSWTDGKGRPSDSYAGTRRVIQEVELYEVTATAFPAYPTTKLAARHADDDGEMEDLRLVVKFLRARAAFDGVTP